MPNQNFLAATCTKRTNKSRFRLNRPQQSEYRTDRQANKDLNLKRRINKKVHVRKTTPVGVQSLNFKLSQSQLNTTERLVHETHTCQNTADDDQITYKLNT